VATTPSPDAEFAAFAGQLFFRLWRVTHARTAQALEPVGLTPPLFGLLNLIAVSEGATQQEIGVEMAVDPSTMVSLIDQLERAGLAKRRPHPTDRRARAVALTPKGRRVLERARGLATEVQDDVLRGLTGDERRELLTLLRRALESAPPQSLWRAGEGD
jgi:DNA-binding MarR family transcriptional regulator